MSSDELQQQDDELTRDLEVGEDAEDVRGGLRITSDPEEGGQLA
jgi:hypothetical protein